MGHLSDPVSSIFRTLPASTGRNKAPGGVRRNESSAYKLQSRAIESGKQSGRLFIPAFCRLRYSISLTDATQGGTIGRIARNRRSRRFGSANRFARPPFRCRSSPASDPGVPPDCTSGSMAQVFFGRADAGQTD